MSILRLSRRLRDSIKYCSTVRRLTTAPPETYFLMGRHGILPFSGERCVELGKYLQQRSILQRVSSDRLYGEIEKVQPFKTNDLSRYLARSALFLPYFSNIKGKSYSGAFRMDNVGVIEDLGLLTFKELKEDSGGAWLLNSSAGYNECGLFLQNILSSVGVEPDEMCFWFAEMANFTVDVDFVLYHAAGMPDAEYEYMMVDIRKILRNRCPQIGHGSFAGAILTGIAKRLNVPDFLLTCQRHAVLNQFLPEYLRNPAFSLNPPGGGGGGGVPAAGGPAAAGNPSVAAAGVPGAGGFAGNPFVAAASGAGNPSGGAAAGVPGTGGSAGNSAAAAAIGAGNPSSAAGGGPSSGNPSSNATSLPTITAFKHIHMGILAVDTARNTSAHSDDKHLRDLLHFLPGNCDTNLKNVPLGREVIRAFRYHAPSYVPAVFKAFRTSKYWDVLELRDRIPIPTIYYGDPKK